MEERPSREQYFIELAEAASRRATCDRARVGCVIVSKFGHVISSGYNGSLPGELHCDQIGHQMENGHCVRTIHAEINAIAACARQGISTEDASLFTTHSPCNTCFRVLKQAGITHIVAKKLYGEPKPEVQLHITDTPKYPPLPPCRHCGTTDLCECQDQ